MPPLRALPRVFFAGAVADSPFELPAPELDKFRKVLRLSTGDFVAVLPNDGSLIVCQLEGRHVVPIRQEWPDTEVRRNVWIAQALPKPDRLETVVRMGTELGVRGFIIFPSRRSVSIWEPAKRAEKLRRIAVIAREAAEQSFRCRVPELLWVESLAEALKVQPNTLVLSEREAESKRLVDQLERFGEEPICLVTGPEGGWDPKEFEVIGDQGCSLGPLVYRTDTASIVAATLAIHQAPEHKPT